MNRGTSGPVVLLAVVTLAAGPAWSADTPEMTAQKQELQQAYQRFFDDGVCSVFHMLRLWQAANWPEGRPRVLQFLQEKLLPRYAQDPAAMKGKSPDQIEVEFVLFCEQIITQAGQILKNLDADPNTEQARALQDTMLAAIVLGECKTVSALYLQGKPESNLREFVVDKIYAQQDEYRQVRVDPKVIEEGNVAAVLENARANEERERRYWRDCDMIDAKFKEIFEQLKPAP